MLWLVLSAGGRKMRGPGKSDIFSLALKVSLLSVFCSTKGAVWPGEVIVRSEEAVCRMHSARNSHSYVKFHL